LNHSTTMQLSATIMAQFGAWIAQYVFSSP
jgi:hypothetical protein